MPPIRSLIPPTSADTTVVGQPDAVALRCPGCDDPVQVAAGCPSCVTCARCGDVVPAVDAIRTVRGSTICDECTPAHYWQCEDCGGWNQDGVRCGNGCCDPDGCDCEDCRADEDDDSYLIRSYDYKPSPVFHGGGPLFLGTELEIETPYNTRVDCAELAVAHLGAMGYLKDDCSLDHGFEIVTHPMSYPWAVNHFPWPMLDALTDAGCITDDGTGLHVHLSRTGFSSSCHTYRWLKFLHRNQPHVVRFAGRSSQRWAAFTDADRRSVKHYAKGASSDRYRAVNTSNPDTFELRVFASSLNPHRVQAVLGFAAASVEYTRALTSRDILARGGWEWSAFAEWVSRQPGFQPLCDTL